MSKKGIGIIDDSYRNDIKGFLSANIWVKGTNSLFPSNEQEPLFYLNGKNMFLNENTTFVDTSGSVLNNFSFERGLCLFILQPDTNSNEITSTATAYDLSSTANMNALEIKLNGMTKNQLGVLVSKDRIVPNNPSDFTDFLKTAFLKKGLIKLRYYGATASDDLIPYSAVFSGNKKGTNPIISSSEVIEVIQKKDDGNSKGAFISIEARYSGLEWGLPYVLPSGLAMNTTDGNEVGLFFNEDDHLETTQEFKSPSANIADIDAGATGSENINAGTADITTLTSTTLNATTINANNFKANRVIETMSSGVNSSSFDINTGEGLYFIKALYNLGASGPTHTDHLLVYIYKLSPDSNIPNVTTTNYFFSTLVDESNYPIITIQDGLLKLMLVNLK